MGFKKPKSGGVAKARETFNKVIKQQPSNELIEIIEDVLRENEGQPKKLKIAAKHNLPETDI